MDDLDAALRQLVERQAIEEVLLRYASTIDYKDYATLRTLFCDDIRGQYGDVVVEGGDALLQWIDDMTVDKSWQHHLLSVYHIDLISDTEAEALTYHTSHQIGPRRARPLHRASSPATGTSCARSTARGRSPTR